MGTTVAKQPETRFGEKFRKELNAIPYSWWQKIQAGSIRGVPDVLGLVSGRFVALELKMPGNTASPLQKHRIRSILKAGGYARVVYPNDVSSVLAELHLLSRGVYENGSRTT